MSNFKTKLEPLDLILMPWINSQASNILPLIALPLTKHVWFGEIILESRTANRLAMILKVSLLKKVA